jgi:DNA-binding SARP family transcriptional activator/tetratricopeptide (TPR) repeat protein
MQRAMSCPRGTDTDLPISRTSPIRDRAQNASTERCSAVVARAGDVSRGRLSGWAGVRSGRWLAGPQESGQGVAMEFRILGPFEVVGSAGLIDLRGAKRRGLLACLVVHAGHPLSTDRLVDELWGDAGSGGAARTVQTYVSQLRKLLQGEAAKLVTSPSGYLLKVDPAAVDARRFEQTLTAASAETDLTRRLTLLDRALALWRGPPLDEFAGAGWAGREATRLDALRLQALRRRYETLLDLGRAGEAVGELETLVGVHPLDEGLWAHLMLALYRSGRQADPLAAYQRARRHLVDELGIEPGPELIELEHRILDQDPTLVVPADSPVNVVSGTVTATFLFCDLVGSTALLTRLGDDAGDEVRRECYAVFREALAAHRGSEVKSTGDGVFAVFPTSVENAVACGVAMQRGMASLAGARPQLGLGVRVGIAMGEAKAEEGDWYGTPVVEAERLCTAAQRGQILASETVRVLAGSRGGHDFVAVGELDLKGLPPVAAVAVRWSEAAPVTVATLRAKGNRRRVPAVGRLLGRDRELDSLLRALEAGGPVLVLGPGGIGKSTLCRAALRDAAMPTPGLAGWFIRCDGLTDVEAVVSAIGRELAIAPGANLLNRTLDGLASTPGVLVLDNAETPWQADTARLEELLEELADVDGLRLVVAMRLGVPPLRPSWAHVERVGPLEPEPAAALFATIAGMSDDVDRVASLIAAVDRVPLAVELLAFAAQTESSLERLATRWQLERAALLDRGVGAADPRLSVPASVELSWNGAFMGVEAQRVGALLALAPAGLSLVDLDRVVPDGAARGAAKLRQQALAFDDGERLRMLAPIREHVATHHPPRDEDRNRLLDLWARLAVTDGFAVGSDGGEAAAQRLDAEAANVEVGIAELVALGRVEAAGRAAVALSNYYGFSGAPAGRGLQLVMDAAHSPDNASTLAATSRYAALLAMHRSEPDTARHLLDQSLTLSRRLGDALAEAHCLKNLGELLMVSDVVAARGLFQEALEGYQKTEHVYRQPPPGSLDDVGRTRMKTRLGVADCYLRLGELELHGSHVAARRLFRQAIRIYQSIGHRRGDANCLIDLGILELQESMNEKARELINQALPICKNVGYPQGEANCYLMLGRLDLADNLYGAAQANVTRALSLFEQLGDGRGRDDCYETLSELRHETAER